MPAGQQFTADEAADKPGSARDQDILWQTVPRLWLQGDDTRSGRALTSIIFFYKASMRLDLLCSTSGPFRITLLAASLRGAKRRGNPEAPAWDWIASPPARNDEDVNAHQ
jgi:hypothetical protein